MTQEKETRILGTQSAPTTGDTAKLPAPPNRCPEFIFILYSPCVPRLPPHHHNWGPLLRPGGRRCGHCPAEAAQPPRQNQIQAEVPLLPFRGCGPVPQKLLRAGTQLLRSRTEVLHTVDLGEGQRVVPDLGDAERVPAEHVPGRSLGLLVHATPTAVGDAVDPGLQLQRNAQEGQQHECGGLAMHPWLQHTSRTTPRLGSASRRMPLVLNIVCRHVPAACASAARRRG